MFPVVYVVFIYIFCTSTSVNTHTTTHEQSSRTIYRSRWTALPSSLSSYPPPSISMSASHPLTDCCVHQMNFVCPGLSHCSHGHRALHSPPASFSGFMLSFLFLFLLFIPLRKKSWNENESKIMAEDTEA